MHFYHSNIANPYIQQHKLIVSNTMVVFNIQSFAYDCIFTAYAILEISHRLYEKIVIGSIHKNRILLVVDSLYYISCLQQRGSYHYQLM
jgi:hypothetical protein